MNIDIKKEALFVLCNTVTGTEINLRADIYNKTEGKIFISVINALRINDVRLLSHVVDAIDALLALEL